MLRNMIYSINLSLLDTRSSAIVYEQYDMSAAVLTVAQLYNKSYLDRFVMSERASFKVIRNGTVE